MTKERMISGEPGASNTTDLPDDEDPADGRCPECGEDEMDGGRCHYCGYKAYRDDSEGADR